MNLLKKLKPFVIYSLFFIGLQSTSAWGKDMKEEVSTFATRHYEKTMNDNSLTAQQRLYQLSMPLIAFATIKEGKSYQDNLISMQLIIKENLQNPQIEKPWELWMLGRMAIASKLAGDSESLVQIKNRLGQQLIEHDNKDVITGWAFAYFAAIDKNSYEQAREKLLEYTEFAKSSYQQSPTTEASNLIWTLTMNLFASANAGNTNDYHYYLEELKSLSEAKTLKDSTKLVPMDDYRQWLVSLARYSFTLMNDQTSLDELENIADSKIESLDSMLAWANEILSGSLTLNANDLKS